MMKNISTRINSFTISLAVVISLGVFGLLLPGSYTSYFYGILELIVLVYSLNIITGLSGYANFGHIVFYGFGAYVVGVTITLFHPLGFIPHTFLIVMLAGVVAAGFALIVGTPVLRLRGDYFAIATLGIVEAVRVTTQNIKFLGEGRGLYFLGKIPLYSIKYLYSYLFVIAVAVVLATGYIFRHRLGYGLRAIKADEDVAEVMGVNTAKYKIMAYCIAASFAGMAGGVMALFFAAAFPEYYLLGRSVELFAAIILGGVGSMLGPLIGAAVFWIIKDFLLVNFPYTHLVLFGAILVILVLFFPIGILGLINKVLAKKGKVLE